MKILNYNITFNPFWKNIYDYFVLYYIYIILRDIYTYNVYGGYFNTDRAKYMIFGCSLIIGFVEPQITLISLHFIFNKFQDYIHSNTHKLALYIYFIPQFIVMIFRIILTHTPPSILLIYMDIILISLSIILCIISFIKLFIWCIIGCLLKSVNVSININEDTSNNIPMEVLDE